MSGHDDLLDAGAERVARAFHETYERLAPDHGYKTREASAVPWEDVPEANRNLMEAVVRELLERGVIYLAADADGGALGFSEQQLAGGTSEAPPPGTPRLDPVYEEGLLVELGRSPDATKVEAGSDAVALRLRRVIGDGDSGPEEFNRLTGVRVNDDLEPDAWRLV